MTLQQNIGQKVKLLRMAKGYSQENMAEMIDMSVSWYSKLERGEVQDIGILQIEKIAKLFELNVSDLLKLVESQNIFLNNTNSINGTLNSQCSIMVNEKDIETLQLSVKELHLLLTSVLQRLEKVEKNK